MSARGTLAAALVVVAHAPSAQAAPVKQVGAVDGVDAVVSKAVKSNYGALHGCYRKVLAMDRTRGGTIFVRAMLGRGDTVASVKIERDEVDQSGAAGLARCVSRWVRGWTIEGAARAGAGRGSDVVIPITFRPAPKQYAVWLDDVLPRPVPSSKSTVQVLTHASNVGARRAAMALLAVRGRLQLMARPGADQALYVLGGRGWIKRRRRRLLRAGDAVWLPPGMRAWVGGRGLRLLQVFVPAGAESAYLGRPHAGGARANPSEPRGAAMKVIRQRAARRLDLAGGKMQVVPLLHGATMGHQRFYLGVLRASAGMKVKAHDHGSEAELLLVRRGAGRMLLGGVPTSLGADQAIYIPARAKHTVDVTADLDTVQVYAPAGPEQRFFKAATR